MEFVVPADHKVKVKMKEGKKLDKYQIFAREVNKGIRYEFDNNTYRSWRSWKSFQEPEKETDCTGS